MALIFNPPPNWPKPPKGWKPTPTWRPDPAWGPVPAGWQLWIEEPTDSADFNDEGTAYEEPMDELPAHVGDDYTLAGDDSVIAPTPQEHAQHSPAGPPPAVFLYRSRRAQSEPSIPLYLITHPHIPPSNTTR